MWGLVELAKLLYHVLMEPYSIHISESQVSISGRVRGADAKDMIKKQLGELASNQPVFMDLQTGQIKSKKAPKEKSPLQISLQGLKLLPKKFLDSCCCCCCDFWGFPGYRTYNRTKIILPTVIIYSISPKGQDHDQRDSQAVGRDFGQQCAEFR